MIYLYHGTDIDTSRTKALDLIESLRRKKPDASFFRVDSETITPELLEEYTSGQGLFVEKSIVLITRPCENKETKSVFLDYLDLLRESHNIFIVLEGKVDKATLTKLEKKSEKVVVCDLSLKKASKEYNAFALADAVGSRNKKEAWILYVMARKRGEVPEALHGMIFWKIKTILLNKSFSTWKESELKAMLTHLITIYHESRKGGVELDSALEETLLTL